MAAAELLCEIQTVLGRATSRLLKSWKHVQSLDSTNQTANEFIAKVEKKGKEKSESIIIKKRKDFSTKTEKNETKKLVKPKLEKESVQKADESTFFGFDLPYRQPKQGFY